MVHEAITVNEPPLKAGKLSRAEWLVRVVLALVFTSAGGLIYLVFHPLRPLLDPDVDYLGRIGVILLLLAIAWMVRRSRKLAIVHPLVIGLLIMAAAVSLDRIFSIYLIDYVGVSATSPAGWAAQKLNEACVVVGTVIALTLWSGGTLGSIYIQKGNLGLALITGSILFLLAAAASIPMATFLFNGRDLTLERILPWVPWLLIFVLANATQEELLFRGLFLGKLQPFFGKLLSNVLVMLVFTLLHQGVTYTSDQIIFLAAVIPLSLMWGYLVQKTGSIWASILFHAGMDIPIMLGIFSNHF